MEAPQGSGEEDLVCLSMWLTTVDWQIDVYTTFCVEGCAESPPSAPQRAPRGRLDEPVFFFFFFVAVEIC